MNQLCLFTNLSSSDVASWAQAVVGMTAIVAGAAVAGWQSYKARREATEREVRKLRGLAHMLSHLRDRATEAYTPSGPLEAFDRLSDIADAINRLPLESVHGDLTLEAILNAHSYARSLPKVLQGRDTANIDIDFTNCINGLQAQISLLRSESDRLLRGLPPRVVADPLS